MALWEIGMHVALLKWPAWDGPAAYTNSINKGGWMFTYEPYKARGGDDLFCSIAISVYKGIIVYVSVWVCVLQPPHTEVWPAVVFQHPYICVCIKHVCGACPICPLSCRMGDVGFAGLWAVLGVCGPADWHACVVAWSWYFRRCLIITLGPSVHAALLSLNDVVGQMLRNTEEEASMCPKVWCWWCTAGLISEFIGRVSWLVNEEIKGRESEHAVSGSYHITVRTINSGVQKSDNTSENITLRKFTKIKSLRLEYSHFWISLYTWTLQACGVHPLIIHYF